MLMTALALFALLLVPVESAGSLQEPPAIGSCIEGKLMGERIQPVADKIWLVVLESYFTISSARHVEVRHRFFHDAEDFRRLCAEVTYLAEPVVLLISSHGSEAGIRVGGGNIDAAVIAASTREASNLKLLLVSGCSMMNGEVPQQVMQQVPADARFPISGYRTSVAWDASAISDFIFLSFLLIHGMDPAEAVRQSILVAPFMGSQETEGAAVVPLGLDLLLPPALEAAQAPTGP